MSNVESIIRLAKAARLQKQELVICCPTVDSAAEMKLKNMGFELNSARQHGCTSVYWNNVNWETIDAQCKSTE